MRVFNRKTTETNESEYLTKARKRVEKMSTHSLLDWSDAAGTGMSKAFMDYRTTGDSAALDEISDAVDALRALVDELKVRQDV